MQWSGFVCRCSARPGPAARDAGEPASDADLAARDGSADAGIWAAIRTGLLPAGLLRPARISAAGVLSAGLLPAAAAPARVRASAAAGVSHRLGRALDRNTSRHCTGFAPSHAREA